MRPLLAILLALACCEAHAKPPKKPAPKPAPAPAPVIEQPAVPAPLPGLELVWSDEFNGDKLDLTKWLPHAHWRNSYDPSDVFVKDGACHLVLRKSHNWRSADISTYGKFAPQFGYFECRVRNIGGQGNHAWAAFFTTRKVPNATGSSETQSAELDVFEILGAFPRDRQMVLHSNTGSGGNTPDRTWDRYDKLPDPTAWVVYGCHWMPTGIDFYRDGVRIAAGPLGSPYSQEILASHNQPQFLMLANWECDFYEPAYVNEKSPDSMTMSIDWVRFWK